MEHGKDLDFASHLLLSGFSWRAVSGRRAMQSVPLGRKWWLEAGILLGPGKTFHRHPFSSFRLRLLGMYYGLNKTNPGNEGEMKLYFGRHYK